MKSMHLPKNVLPPLSIGVLSLTTLTNQSFDFVYCCNLIHIKPIECIQGLFRLAERVLKSEVSLITYGLPSDGRITPESNRRFHAYLQMQDSRGGLRGIHELAMIANDHHIELKPGLGLRVFENIGILIGFSFSKK